MRICREKNRFHSEEVRGFSFNQIYIGTCTAFASWSRPKIGILLRSLHRAVREKPVNFLRHHIMGKLLVNGVHYTHTLHVFKTKGYTAYVRSRCAVAARYEGERGRGRGDAISPADEYISHIPVTAIVAHQSAPRSSARPQIYIRAREIVIRGRGDDDPKIP